MSLPALKGVGPSDASGEALNESLVSAAAFADQTARNRDDAHARQAASALYYAVAAAVLWREGERLAAWGDARRLLLAALVHEHRLRARDPLRPARAAFESELAGALLPETPVSLHDAQSLLELFKL